MIALVGEPKVVEAANYLRNIIMQIIPDVLNSPHTPELTPEEKQKLLNKLDWLARNEHRAQFFLNLTAMQYLIIGTAENPTRLTNTLLKWAGKTKPPKYKEAYKKIPDCKNGRIIRNARGL